MLKKILCVLVIVCFGLVGKINAQQVFKVSNKSKIGYLEYLPLDYSTNSKKYPIVIFLHGIGERGVNSTDSIKLATTIQNVAKHGPPKHVKYGNQFPFILISPQLKSNFGTWPSWYVMEVLNEARQNLRVDEKKIYITGLSLGGGGVWVTIQDFPKVFAASAPVCGGYNSTSKACNIANEHLPVWAFHGDKDTTVPLSRSVNMVNAINNCNADPKAIMTIYSGVGHNAWDRAYELSNKYHLPNLYDWLLSYTNKTNGNNKIPTANAGNDIITSNSNYSIKGSGEDLDGSVTYHWSIFSKPANSIAILKNENAALVTIDKMSLGKYVLKLTITDNNNDIDTDYVTVNVESNQLPIANAGADIIADTSYDTLYLHGTGTDDGQIVRYEWKKLSGNNVTMIDDKTSSLKITNFTAGKYVFSLRVWDDKNATCKATDKVDVYITAK